MKYVLSKFYFIFKALYVIAVLRMNDLNLISLDLQVSFRKKCLKNIFVEARIFLLSASIG